MSRSYLALFVVSRPPRSVGPHIRDFHLVHGDALACGLAARMTADEISKRHARQCLPTRLWVAYHVLTCAEGALDAASAYGSTIAIP
jgi:hypothetical protein